jgi:hypothetical protein
VTTKVFVNREQKAQKEVEQKIKKKVALLAAALNRRGRHSSSWDRG